MHRKKLEEPLYVVGSPDGKFRRLRSRKITGEDDDSTAGNGSKREGGGGGEVDAESSWVDAMWQRVQESRPGHRHGRESCTIYKIPADIRRQNSRIYLPTVVSIGPYHYSYGRREPLFGDMQNYKWKCLGYLLRRRGGPETDSKTLLDRCLEEMKLVEAKVQSCYSRVVEMDNNEFAEMLLLDGCFILQLLLEQETPEEHDSGDNGEREGQLQEEEIPKLAKSWIWSRVVYDLLLLENQIPFFVIQHLFRLLKTPSQTNVSLPNLALKLFSSLYPKRNPEFSVRPDLAVHHLLHLFYLSILPSSTATTHIPAAEECTLSASHLREEGIKFKKKENPSSFLDISFENGVIRIPPLQIYEYSTSLFGNLIAFEQCYPETQGHVTTYATFMEWIMSNTRKMKMFHMEGVVINRLRTDRKIGEFFDGLSSYVPSSSSGANYLGDMFMEVARHRGTTWRRWSATLVRDGCDQWVMVAVVAAVAAIAVLVLNIIQTFVSVSSYLNPPS